MDRIGQQLGNYQLLRRLGIGGFAEVYLGEHIYLKTLAAIKVLHTQLEQADMERFLTEARTIASFVHPHIVRVLDFGVEEGTPFLVMDYAPHGSLHQRYASRVPQPPQLILPYVQQVADALKYAHSANRIHRDIKPENLLLGRNEEVWVSDFGMAVAARVSSQQHTDGFVGTPAYVAPEQLQGRPVFASDQYALAVVVYEWLTGDVPFDGAPLEVIAQHVMTPPQPLRERVGAISPALEAVVLKALAKDPSARFASVAEFAAAFTDACQSTSYIIAGWEPPPPVPEQSDQESTLPGSATTVDALLFYPGPALDPTSKALTPDGVALTEAASNPSQQEALPDTAEPAQEPPVMTSAEAAGEEQTLAAMPNQIEGAEHTPARGSGAARPAVASRRSQILTICLAALTILVILPTLAYGAIELRWIGQRPPSLPASAGAFAFPGTDTPSPTAPGATTTPLPSPTETATTNPVSSGVTAPTPTAIPPAPPPAAPIAFTATPTSQIVSCSDNYEQAARTITLNNTRSTVDVTWQISFPGQPWAFPFPASGSVSAGRQSTMMLILFSLACDQRGGNVYQARISYTARGVSNQVIISIQIG